MHSPILWGLSSVYFCCQGGKCFHSKLLWLKNPPTLNYFCWLWSLPHLPYIQWALTGPVKASESLISHKYSMFYLKKNSYTSSASILKTDKLTGFLFLLDASNFIANNIQILSFFHCSTHILTEFSHSVTLKLKKKNNKKKAQLK